MLGRAWSRGKGRRAADAPSRVRAPGPRAGAEKGAPPFSMTARVAIGWRARPCGGAAPAAGDRRRVPVRGGSGPQPAQAAARASRPARTQPSAANAHSTAPVAQPPAAKGAPGEASRTMPPATSSPARTAKWRMPYRNTNGR